MPPPERPRVLATVFSRASLSRCVPIALLVGTLLSWVNQGSVIASGEADAATAVRVAVNFVVPFCVSSAGFLSCRRAAWRTATLSSTRGVRAYGVRMSDFESTLRALRVWDTDLPTFAPETAPTAPLLLFHDWFVAAAQAGQAEPHTMSLATVDENGRPDVRTVMLHDADERGWHFASHATSVKGRQLAAHPEAALGFYWPVQGRQVRVRGRVVTGTAEEAYEDLHARTTGALASALVGRQSEVLGSAEELTRASEAAWERANAEPDAHSPTWTLYVLEPAEVEFFQGDEQRRHVRLRYRREAGGWVRELLWP